MERKQRIIYNNYDICDMYDECKAFLEEAYPEEKPIAENAIWDEVYEQDRITWEDEESQLNDFFCNTPVIVCASLGLWTGRRGGYNDFPSLQDAFRSCFKDCDYIKIWDEDGHFLMQGSHHDGTNYYQLKILNDNGADFLENTNMEYPEALRLAFNSNLYSRLPHYAHIVYGVPKRETAV